MKCPHCNETLLMTERHNIEIDYCPNCRGIWLDKGELDKMLQYVEEKYKTGQPGESSQGQQSAQNNQASQGQQSNQASQGYQGYQGQQYQQPYPNKHDYDDDDHHKYNPNYHKRKKKGFLGDLFDFD